uniref:Uncharacterized protein n=1 Tax=Arundo donax TaxID=35708 RepID=A0A0A9FHP5_ARUDO
MGLMLRRRDGGSKKEKFSKAVLIHLLHACGLFKETGAFLLGKDL